MAWQKNSFRKPSPPQPSSPPPEGEQTIRGCINRFTFRNGENGFSIARFIPEVASGGTRKGEEVVVTGTLEGIVEGEALELTGQWTRNPKFGTQFTITAYRPIPPSSIDGIRAFLGSGMIAGIGKEYAGRIVDTFGEDTLKIIDTEPERLREVDGIGPIRFERITKGWSEHRAIADIMSFLQSYAISSTWASKIYRFYGSDAVRVMRENPYRLAIDMRGMGFKSADKIAQSAGIAHDSPERVQAGVLHLLREAAGKGHTFYPFDDLTKEGLEMLGIEEPKMIREATAELCKAQDNPQDPLKGKQRAHLVAEKLPEGDKAVYLAGLHAAETRVCELLMTLKRVKKPLHIPDPKGEIARYEAESNFELEEHQRAAVDLALRGGVVVLTGGPGTGKTTTLRAVITSLKRHGVLAALAAPTGRAAKRLAETTGMEASTIHRLLKYDPKKGGFSFNETNPLPIDFLIVDEASMLDIALTHQLLRAIPPTASVLLVGDVDQLPSVGPGDVLRDLIRSEVFPVVRLQKIFRQARKSLIVMNAHRVNEGEFPMLIPFTKQSAEGTPIGEEEQSKSDFLFVGRDDPEQAADAIEQLIAEEIPARFGFDSIRDIQLLTPMHKGVLGAANLNRRLQARLNKDPRNLVHGDMNIKVGDKVMQTENDYDKDVFNGDIGIVAEIDRVDHFIRVRYDNHRIVQYEYADLDELTLSYAITVHKSQGSEYPVVVLPVHTQHYVMLQRNLFYTGITRGKKLVVCVGTKRAIGMAISNAQVSVRHSGLRQRLIEAEKSF